MALAVDGSAPIRFTGTPGDNIDITSASFTPPANSLMMCAVNTNSNAQATLVSVSDSEGGTWVEEVRRNLTEAGLEGHASIWRRTTAVTAVSMTVSVRRTNDSGGTGAFDRVSAKVYVITGQHATPIPTTGEGSSTTNNLTASIFTSAHANSLALVCGTDWNANGLPTSSDLTIDAFNHAGVLSGLSGYKTLGTAGAETANLDAAGTAAAEWNWCAVEIREAVDGEFSGTLSAQSVAMAGNLSVIGGFSGALLSASPVLAGEFFTSLDVHGILLSQSATASGVLDVIVSFSGNLQPSVAELLGEFDVITPPVPISDVRYSFTRDNRKFQLYLGPRRS